MIIKKYISGNPVQIDTHLARVFRLKKGVMTTARLVNDRLAGEKIRWVPLMVTLTYKDVDAWKPEHIADFMKTVNAWGKRKGFTLPYVWVMELQKRGAPHFHVLLWIPKRLRLPEPDKRRRTKAGWQDAWWSWGDSNIKRVRNPVGYVAKYASKFESKDCKFPKGARIHGIGGIKKLEKRIIAWWKLPKDLRTGEEGSCIWRRALGGGWINPETEEKILPKWEIKEGIWAANLVYVVPISHTVEEVEEHCCYKAWHATRRQARAVLLCQNGSNRPSIDYQYLGQAVQQHLWRVDHVRRLRLAFRRDKGLSAGAYFAQVELASLPF